MADVPFQENKDPVGIQRQASDTFGLPARTLASASELRANRQNDHCSPDPGSKGPWHGRASRNAPPSSETSVGTLALDLLSAFFGSPDAYGPSQILRLPAGQL